MTDLSHSFQRAKKRDFALETAQSFAFGSGLTFLGTAAHKAFELSVGASSDIPVTIAMGVSFVTASCAATAYALLRLREFQHSDRPNTTGQRLGISAGILAPLALTAAVYSPMAEAAPKATPPTIATLQAPDEDLTLPQLLCRITNPAPRGCEHAPKKSSSQELKTLAL